MRNTPMTKLTLAAAIAVAGLATSATAQDAQAPKAKVSSSTTIMKSGDGQSYEIKLEDGQVVTFKLNGKSVDPDSYKIDTEGGFIVLKDGDHEPIIIDIPQFNMGGFDQGVVGGLRYWNPEAPPAVPGVPGVVKVRPAPGEDNIHWFDGPDAPDVPAAIAWAGQEPPKVMIGITHDEVSDELREEFGLKDGEGIYVIEVRKDLPADKAGIESGDVIIEVDGQRISKRDVLMDVMKKHEPGDKLTVIVLRDGEKKKLKLELAPFNADRLGAPRAMTLRSGEPREFKIRINKDDMEFGDLEDFEPFGDFDFDFDMEGLPPEAKAELERALRNAREQANEARARAFTLRRDAHGQHELHELKVREQGDHMHEQADRLRAHAERLSTDNRNRAAEMQKLEERLAKLRELGDDDRLFRAAPNGRAFIIEREGDAHGLANIKPEVQELIVQRDTLTARNRELEARVDQLERKLDELMKRLEKNESGKTR